MKERMESEKFKSPTSSEEELKGFSTSVSTLLGIKKLPIDAAEWESYFDESGQILKSRNYMASQILERGLDLSVRSEAWKFLTGYYPWKSSYDERLTTDSMRRCSDVQRLYIKDAQGNPLVDKKQLEKILLLNYVCNVNAEYQQGFHEMLLLFRLLVEEEHEIYWLFQFFLQKTENSCIINVGVQKNLLMLKALVAFMDPIFAKHLETKGQVVSSLFPWFCLFFQRVFKSFEDVWRLWEVFLIGHPCRNFQVIVAYTMLQIVRDQILREDLEGDDILMLCHSIVDLDADDLITKACNIYELFQKHEDKINAKECDNIR
ncbi:TBC1 domain family member 21 [Protobothrops mucrosquamatus]|uniref:TBC1 domain family member 21 n=1 Tax=Protobothrops mucrosquamatus TaxID=103944 RepID=UPI000775D52B|nr:TBC1 domain family member 21 [Protobothrops mucrosquamatus]